ncbi:MAG: hypothetical protein CM1200mP25_4130 [Acidobacteriota bacterium]|nr:MAG: hypothetical protein CM1200mP25_4130 [Acidobacteriota bacterium]
MSLAKTAFVSRYGLHATFRKDKSAIAQIQPGKVDFMVNSHYHYDHASGNAAFGLESVIVAHESIRRRLMEGREAGANFPGHPDAS